MSEIFAIRTLYWIFRVLLGFNLDIEVEEFVKILHPEVERLQHLIHMKLRNAPQIL